MEGQGDRVADSFSRSRGDCDDLQNAPDTESHHQEIMSKRKSEFLSPGPNGRKKLASVRYKEEGFQQLPCRQEIAKQPDSDTLAKNRHTAKHTFKTNVLDHCETPQVAYEHIVKFLEIWAKSSKNQPATNLTIWDPYYCDGSMKETFQHILGFPNIVHENVDFYRLIEDKKIPEHDIFVTNPPYSDDHMDRLLHFIVFYQLPRNIPCCLLLPNWVSRQQDYIDKFVTPIEKTRQELFYLAPLQAYTYTMPTWVSQIDRPSHVGSNGQTTPYLTCWYIIVPPDSNSKVSFLERMDAIAKQQKPPAWVVAKTAKGLKWKIQKLNGQEKEKRKRKNRRGKRRPQT
jgi:hypothetical protein